ncbi:hypothetical protein DPMN_071416 [Dreissena polymorpha]|uniref:Uncharacterized protein n=1 Tax=Dreissena polymorpha TaxID=45954 RepID=A0A9D3Z291_DREPO|nr:hypothetical protein DPMN_071416 [Dreissena polymorpha]
MEDVLTCAAFNNAFPFVVERALTVEVTVVSEVKGLVVDVDEVFPYSEFDNVLPMLEFDDMLITSGNIVVSPMELPPESIEDA